MRAASFSALFDPVRSRGSDTPAFPYPGSRRVSPVGLKRRLKAFVAEGGVFPTAPKEWAHGLAKLLDAQLPERLEALLEVAPPALVWGAEFQPEQPVNAYRQIHDRPPVRGSLLHQLFELSVFHRPAWHAPEAPERCAQVAEWVGRGLEHTPDPLPGEATVWAEVFAQWLQAGSIQHLTWIATAVSRRPDLVYARALVRPQPEPSKEGPQRDPLPVLLTHGDDASRWNQWQCWGGDPNAEATEDTVPNPGIPRAFAMVRPTVIPVGFALATQGVLAAQQWLAQAYPELETHREAIALHRTLDAPNPSYWSLREVPASLQTLVTAPAEAWEHEVSPLWSAMARDPRILTRDYLASSPEPRIAILMGWDEGRLTHELARAQSLAGEDLWTALFASMDAMTDWGSVPQLEEAATQLLERGLFPSQGESAWAKCPDYLMKTDRLADTSKATYRSFSSLLMNLARRYPEVLLGTTEAAQRTLARRLWSAPDPGKHRHGEWGRTHMLVWEALPKDQPLVPELRALHVASRALFHAKLDFSDPWVQLATQLTVAWPEASQSWVVRAMDRQHGVGLIQTLRLHHDRQHALAQRPAIPPARPRRRS